MRKIFFIITTVFIFTFLSESYYISGSQYLLKDITAAYTPEQIKHAYGIDLLNGKGDNQKIAIIVPYGSSTIEKDMEIFNRQFNLDKTDMEIFYPEGKPDKEDISWALETSLDVEWVHALAPKASILLVVAKSDSIEDLIKAIDYSVKIQADIVSMSWTIDEFEDEISYESHFENRNVTFVAASGDNPNKVNWPAVSSNVLAVGGTTFSLDLSGNLITSETSWSESSGGISKYITEPKYQVDYGLNTNGYRAVPDVSFYADTSKGVWIYCSSVYNSNNQSGWTTSAGTSLGAPAWSAFISLINEYKKSSVNNIHDSLYRIAKSDDNSINFRNSINNKNLNSNIEKYNFATGLGSPLENNIYKTLTLKN